MAIKNFVNFITDTITPPIINSYGISCPDFCGNDSSTAEYTKLGWVLSCYFDMLKRNLVDDSVRQVVTDVFEVNNVDELRSPGGFNVLQIILYDQRSNKELSLDETLPPQVADGLKKLALIADNPGGQTALHMAVDYGMKKVVEELSSVNGVTVGRIDGAGRTSTYASPWSLGLMRGGEDVVAGDTNTPRVELAQFLSEKSGAYNDFYGKNPIRSGSGGDIENEISKYILTVGKEVLSASIDWLLAGVDGSSGVTKMSAAVASASGISNGNTTYNLSPTMFSAHETGYHPLFFYLYKYKTGVDETVLNKLLQHFSPVSVSVSEDGTTEGFNCVGMAAYYVTATEDGWGETPLLGFIKSTLEACGSDENQIWAVSGNVRDLTASASGNAFGAITNILVKINDIHSAWWGEQDQESSTPSDFEPIYNSLAGEVFPSALNYAFYQKWMVEFGKEIE